MKTLTRINLSILLSELVFNLLGSFNFETIIIVVLLNLYLEIFRESSLKFYVLSLLFSSFSLLFDPAVLLIYSIIILARIVSEGFYEEGFEFNGKFYYFLPEGFRIKKRDVKEGFLNVVMLLLILVFNE